MEKLLKQILVVIDFSDTSRSVIENIIPIANEMDCDVHLLHIVKPSILPVLVDSQHIIATRGHHVAESSNTLMQWQTNFISQVKKGRYLFTHCVQGNEEKQIREYALRHHIDLVVLTHHRPYPWSKLLTRINIDKLARRVQCPVLNMPDPESLRFIHNIVLPVTNALPLRKIMFASYLAKYQDARIHLVALQEDKEASHEENHYLMKAYQLLRDNTNLSVECHPVNGDNIAGTTLHYAEQVKADLIVVQPGKEAELPGLLNNIFSRFLFSASRIPVMAV